SWECYCPAGWCPHPSCRWPEGWKRSKETCSLAPLRPFSNQFCWRTLVDCRLPGSQANDLHELRAFCLSFNTQGHSYRAVFGDAHLGWTGDISARRLILVGPIHVPGRPVMGLFGLQSHTHGSREQFFAEGFVKDAGHVAIVVDANAVARVLKA